MGRRFFGLSILEVVIATGLMLVIGTILVLVMTHGLGQLKRAKTLSIAQSLAQQKMEEVLAKAPEKLALGDYFTSPTDKYIYTIEYTEHPRYEALQNATVNVTGPWREEEFTETKTWVKTPLTVNVAYAAAVTTGGHLFQIAALNMSAPDYTLWYDISDPGSYRRCLAYFYVNKGTAPDTLKVRANCYDSPFSSSLSNNLILRSIKMKRNPGNPTVKISNLTVAGGYSGYGTNVRPGNRIIISFIDRSITPVSFCRFKMFAVKPSQITNFERLEFHTLGVNARVDFDDVSVEDGVISREINLSSSLCISESDMFSTVEPAEMNE